MAKIIFAESVDSITGKVGGTVFQRSYGGYQIRNKPSPRNPRSSYQQAARNHLIKYSQNWRNLSDDTRNTWRDATDTTVTGIQLYNQSLVNATFGSVSGIVDYGPSSYPIDFPIQLLSATPYELIFIATGPVTTPPTGSVMLLSGARQIPQSKKFFSEKSYAPLIYYGDDQDLSVPTNCALFYLWRFLEIKSDMRLSLQASLVWLNNGLRGSRSATDIVVTLP